MITSVIERLEAQGDEEAARLLNRLRNDAYDYSRTISRLRDDKAELLGALKHIRGWREIDVSSDERFGPYNTFPATIKRIEQICDEAIAKHQGTE